MELSDGCPTARSQRQEKLYLNVNMRQNNKPLMRGIRAGRLTMELSDQATLRQQMQQERPRRVR